jgi:hypothetical protein
VPREMEAEKAKHRTQRESRAGVRIAQRIAGAGLSTSSYGQSIVVFLKRLSQRRIDSTVLGPFFCGSRLYSGRPKFVSGSMQPFAECACLTTTEEVICFAGISLLISDGTLML